MTQSGHLTEESEGLRKVLLIHFCYDLNSIRSVRSDEGIGLVRRSLKHPKAINQEAGSGCRP